MTALFGSILTALRKNWLISVGLLVAGVFKLVQEIAPLVDSPLYGDAIFIFCFGAVIVIAVSRVISELRQHQQFARAKLPNRSAIVFAIRSMPKALIANGVLILTILVLISQQAAAIVQHVLPPWQVQPICFRVPEPCRQCVVLNDYLGRDIGGACIKFADDAGLVSLSVDRWSRYQPASISLTCTSGEKIVPIDKTKRKERCATLP